MRQRPPDAFRLGGAGPASSGGQLVGVRCKFSRRSAKGVIGSAPGRSACDARDGWQLAAKVRCGRVPLAWSWGQAESQSDPQCWLGLAQARAVAEAGPKWGQSVPELTGGVLRGGQPGVGEPVGARCPRSAARLHPSGRYTRYCARPASDRHVGAPSASRCPSSGLRQPACWHFPRPRRQSASRQPERRDTASGLAAFPSSTGGR